MQVPSLGQKDTLEEEMPTHSSILALRTPWTVAYQAPLSMEFSRQEYWSGLAFLTPGNLPDSVDSLPTAPPGKPLFKITQFLKVKKGSLDFPGGPVIKNPPCN